MSDPFSVAAGITGFLSLGIQVTQKLFDFYSVYKNQDADIAKFTQNIENLQSTFRLLENAIQKRQAQPHVAELLREVDKATKRCHEIIEELQSECQKLSSDSVTGLKSRIQVAGRRAAYPFRKSTIQKIEEDIGVIRENLSFALHVLQFKSHNRMEHDITAVKSLLERTSTSQISFAIRAWLQAPDPSVNHNALYEKHHPCTGLWFTNGHQFATWLVERNSFLWLNGFAGCGKSVLCSVAIQHTFSEIKQRNEVGIAFFYFAFSDESKQNDYGMLCALLLQLSVQLQDGEKELEQLRMLSWSSSPSVEVLLRTLRRFLDQFQDIYILLDALDECPRDNGREGVLRVIEAIRDWSLPSVHLLITSRDLLDIRRSLNPPYGCDLSMKNSGIDKDILDFVSYQLENDTKLQKRKARHSEIQDKIIQGAQGVFRYVECQLNAFRRARNRNQLDECLRSLPRDLDETYERILCGIDEMYVEDVRRILTVLCFTVRPLTVDELIDAHAVELGEPPYLDREGRSYEQDDLVDICLGLIEIVVTKDCYGDPISTARIAHFSVQEYLQSDRIHRQKAGRFAVHSKTANADMAQICLVYLLDLTLTNGFSGEIKLRDFPLAQFAATNWYHYYQVSEDGKLKTERLVLRLFQKPNYFVNWVRLHDTNRPWSGLEDDMASPVYYASSLGLEAILKSILAAYTGASSLSHIVNVQGGRYGNALQAASAEGHKKVVRMLLDQDADVNAQGGHYGNALQAASARGYNDIVQMLLDQGANINSQGGHYGNALQVASSGGHKELVRMLLDQGADVNSQGGYYGNALQAASARGYKDIVQMLLDQGANVSAQSGEYGNALQAASSGGHKGIVQMLLDQGADVNAQGGVYGNALYVASAIGCKDIVQTLLDQGADVNAQGGHYGNALQAASFRGYKEVVQMLLNQGANVNAQSGSYGNALQGVSAKGDKDIVQTLLDQGADVNSQGGDYGNALQAASAKGHKGIVQMLLDQGANVNARGGHYGNVLQAASARGHKDIVQMLLDQDADVNAQGGDYGNALQAASAKGHKGIVQMLLDQGVDVNAQSGSYGNALQAASVGGGKEVVQVLLDHNADVNAQGGHYGNALQAASAKGHKEVVRMLLDHNADVNAQGGHYGNTLQAASAEGHKEVVQMLLDQDADVNAQSGEYGNALYAASFRGYKEVVRVLLDQGADVSIQGGRYGNALQAASFRGYKEVVQMLLDQGAVDAVSSHIKVEFK